MANKFFSLIISLAVAIAATAQVKQASLLTVGPGSEVYELEGHTVLRLQYADGRDMAINWGVFDFNSPNFIYRFVKGETDYRVAEAPTQWVLDGYRAEGRSVTEQRLALSQRQVEELEHLVVENLRPENRVYRYNYVKDNCATRPLNLIEQALSADSCSLVAAETEATQTTFRDEMRRYHRRFPSYQFGIDLALGSGIDYQITAKEKAFAPVYLLEYLSKAQVKSPSGQMMPLVSSTEVLIESGGEEASESGVPLWLMVYGFLAVAVLVTVRDLRRRKVSKWFDTLLFLVYGIAGCVIFFLIFVSTHESTSPNVNLLWLNPLALLVPCLIWHKSAKKIVFYYQIVNFALVLAFIIGMPLFHQSFNSLFIPLAVASLARSANYIFINHQLINRH